MLAAYAVTCSWFHYESRAYIFNVCLPYRQTVLVHTVCESDYAAISWANFLAGKLALQVWKGSIKSGKLVVTAAFSPGITALHCFFLRHCSHIHAYFANSTEIKCDKMPQHKSVLHSLLRRWLKDLRLRQMWNISSSFKQASSYSKNNYAYNSVARIFLFYTGQSYCMHVAMEGNLSAEFRKSYITFTTIRCAEIFF